MKQKKFSQIYKEAAKKIFYVSPQRPCYYISYCEGNNFSSIDTPAQNYFKELFDHEENENKENKEIANGLIWTTQDRIDRRIIALLLASEIAKSEGL